QLAASGEDVAIRTRHAAHFLALAEQFGDLWRPDPLADFVRIGPDLPNLRAALSWTFAHGETTTFLRLAVALRAYWLAVPRRAERGAHVARQRPDPDRRGAGA